MAELNPKFIDSLAGLGKTVADGLVFALAHTEPSVAIRLNPLKISTEKLNEAREKLRKVEWCDTGFYLEDRPKFTFMPLLHQGGFYVQDPSSMIISRVVAHLSRELAREHGEGPIAYLDACAAPGGKTTAAISSLPEGSLVVANEYEPRRAAILGENLAKWGYGFTMLSKGDTGRFSPLKDTFHIIAADVPCSGEGMMRKDAEARSQWSEGLVAQCAARQREIVEKLWPALRPGGYMIYSTCTFNLEENERIIAWMMENFGAMPVEIPLDGINGIHPAINADFPAMRFMPHLADGEGLFMCVVRKPGDSASTSAPAKTKRIKQSAKPNPQLLKAASMLTDAEKFSLSISPEGIVRATPVTPLLTPSLAKITTPLLTPAIIKGKSLIPTQQLAMMTGPGAPSQIFPRAEVDTTVALHYLKGEAISLSDAPKGHVLLTHDGPPLGFVNNLGNRANNLYPDPWRIISQLPC
ncbi:MAG: hypothetical protein K2M05_02725 [Paramuribaculum sp.]|nr:hypothetical protein [Paramuribaculum sp.]MDE6303524.1 hypothetical protein [Paramuribaculum sp.]